MPEKKVLRKMSLYIEDKFVDFDLVGKLQKIADKEDRTLNAIAIRLLVAAVKKEKV